MNPTVVLSGESLIQHPDANIKYLFNNFTLNALSQIENSHKDKIQSILSHKSFKFCLSFVKYAHILKTFSYSFGITKHFILFLCEGEWIATVFRVTNQ